MNSLAFKLIFILLLIVPPLHGQEGEQYRIDSLLQVCLDNPQNHTTAGMTQCFVSAAKAWEGEMNSNYQMLLKLLKDDQKEQLIRAQREWIKFRKVERNFSGSLYYSMQGTMWVTAAAKARLETVRARALQLSAYLANLNYEEQ